MTPAQLAALLVLLAAVAELKFRRREAELALEGSIDAQIIVELALWGAVVAWLVLRLIRERVPATAFLPTGLGPALLAAYGIAVLSFATSFLSASPVALVRGAQFLVLTLGTVLLYRLIAGDGEQLAAAWIAWRRGMWVVLVGGVVVTVTLFGTALPAVEGQARYAWLAMHPIQTATAMGFALMGMAGAAFGLPDPWLERRRTTGYAVPAALFTAALVLLTKARGATVATVVSIGVVAALSRRRSRRDVATIAFLALGGALFAGVGIDALLAAFTRGATIEQMQTLTGRTELFAIAYDLFLERPLFGYGFLAGRGVFLERFPWAGNAHNLGIEVAISHGAVGLALYAMLFGAIIVAALRALRAARSPAIVAMHEATAVVAFLLLAGVVGSGPASIPGFELAALLMAGLAADVTLASARSAGWSGSAPASRHPALARST